MMAGLGVMSGLRSAEIVLIGNYPEWVDDGLLRRIIDDGRCVVGTLNRAFPPAIELGSCCRGLIMHV